MEFFDDELRSTARSDPLLPIKPLSLDFISSLPSEAGINHWIDDDDEFSLEKLSSEKDNFSVNLDSVQNETAMLSFTNIDDLQEQSFVESLPDSEDSVWKRVILETPKQEELPSAVPKIVQSSKIIIIKPANTARVKVIYPNERKATHAVQSQPPKNYNEAVTRIIQDVKLHPVCQRSDFFGPARYIRKSYANKREMNNIAVRKSRQKAKQRNQDRDLKLQISLEELHTKNQEIVKLTEQNAKLNMENCALNFELRLCTCGELQPKLRVLQNENNELRIQNQLLQSQIDDLRKLRNFENDFQM